MVTATLDPIRVPTLNLSEQELADIQELIESGQLAKDFLERHFDAVDANVFGHDAPKDRHGNRKEQGIGSAGNQTANSIAAYKKYCSAEPGFDETLKRMEAELVESSKKREESSIRARYARKGKRR